LALLRDKKAIAIFLHPFSDPSLFIHLSLSFALKLIFKPIQMKTT